MLSPYVTQQQFEMGLFLLMTVIGPAVFAVWFYRHDIARPVKRCLSAFRRVGSYSLRIMVRILLHRFIRWLFAS